MHPHAEPDLEAIVSRHTREKLRLLLDLFGSMARENARLRSLLEERGMTSEEIDVRRCDGAAEPATAAQRREKG